MPTIYRIPETKLTIRHAPAGVTASPTTGSPAWWATQMVIDRGAGTVRFRTRASSFTFAFETIGPVSVYSFVESQGINTSEGITPLDSEDVGQRVWVTPTLPGTDGREFPVDLVSYTEPGTPRTLRAGNLNVAAPFGVEYVEFFLYEFNGVAWVPTSPRDGGTYSLTISFRPL